MWLRQKAFCHLGCKLTIGPDFGARSNVGDIWFELGDLGHVPTRLLPVERFLQKRQSSDPFSEVKRINKKKKQASSCTGATTHANASANANGNMLNTNLAPNLCMPFATFVRGIEPAGHAVAPVCAQHCQVAMRTVSEVLGLEIKQTRSQRGKCHQDANAKAKAKAKAKATKPMAMPPPATTDLELFVGTKRFVVAKLAFQLLFDDL